MGYQPPAFICRSFGDVLAAVKSLCRSKEFEVIFDHWQDLHNTPPTSFTRADINRVKSEVVKVVHSLQENFALIHELHSILPPTFTLSCHPDVKDGTRTKYFVLLSDSFRLWGEIYSTRPEPIEGLEPVWTSDDINRIVGREAWRETGVEASQRDGWLPCLLDLLSWELEYPWLDIGFRQLLTRTQADLVKVAKQLPFTCHWNYKDLEVKTSFVTNGPAPKCYEGSLRGQGVWVQYFESNGSAGKFEEKVIESALACCNIQHPNLVAWTSLYSPDNEKWVLVTPRGGVSSMQEFYKGSRKENDRFKLDVVKNIAEALYYLNCIERWRGSFTMADVFIDYNGHYQISHYWDSLMPEERQPITTYVVKHPKRFERMQPDAEALGRIVHQMYPSDLPLEHRLPSCDPDLDPSPLSNPGSPCNSVEDLVRWLLLLARGYPGWIKEDLRRVSSLIDGVTPNIELREPKREPSEDSDSDSSTLVLSSPVSEDVDSGNAGFPAKEGLLNNIFKRAKPKQLVQYEQESKKKYGFGFPWSRKGNKGAITVK